MRHRAVPAPKATAELPKEAHWVVVDVLMSHEVHSQQKGEHVEANDRKPIEGIGIEEAQDEGDHPYYDCHVYDCIKSCKAGPLRN